MLGNKAQGGTNEHKKAAYLHLQMLNLRQCNQDGVFKKANIGHKMLGMGNIARQLLLCLGAAPRLQGQLLPLV